ncbi:hypothetical protein CVS40_4641 [Lucilia cuprina]|nr:hypothetical protein CVS40_4641 [Lucilia cuprina]
MTGHGLRNYEGLWCCTAKVCRRIGLNIILRRGIQPKYKIEVRQFYGFINPNNKNACINLLEL